jgi:hypothetical protein
MHPHTPTVAAAVRAAPDLAGRLDALAGAYQGERCVIVTCGPSLGEVPVDRLRRALEGVLTLSVKQAVHVTAEHTDFLCFNSFNVTRFTTPSKNTIRCFAREPTGKTPQLNRADLTIDQATNVGDLRRSLAVTTDFASHPLTAHTPRPWGPGIMYELVLHLAVHLGVAHITTIGWDIGNPQGKNTHFYDRADKDDFFERDRSSAFTMASVRGHIPAIVKGAGRWGRALVAHSRGRVYNRALPVSGETEVVGASTAAANAWLAANGVELEVITPSEQLDVSISRLGIEELLQRSGA